MAIITKIREEEEAAATTTEYDVFLSFSGKDTRLCFIDYLYQALEKKLEGARKLEMWRKGLAEVADLKGKNTTGRREMVVIEEVVEEINTRLELHFQRKIPQLIGMDYSISDISSWLQRGSSETAEILTIWGMAGIGKTALAKHIFILTCC
ncbi:hypothetical protein L2E82_11593 [Cichorium intybus]|uniref:Uncharacterized protein n=1 Tax=Cichorium intybus TaxID=13427 RepID=A0ACB9GER2_CICIN|nr:hypothetical protein L2E82_11593 [Cichorium intybus]